jgi:diketogulonate reductase-like aldo/keto reductase
VESVARELGRTPAQVVLRWHLRRGDIALPKVFSPQRIQHNAAVFDFALTVWRVSTNSTEARQAVPVRTQNTSDERPSCRIYSADRCSARASLRR